ncbi:MAG: hypothetical protein AAF383_26430 [Cyanobacteria bacterium P01_A01_bin.83]
MANLTSDLIMDGSYFELLTNEKLESDLYGGATGAGSVSAGRYFQEGDVVEETAVTSTVATSRSQPFTIDLLYSFEPRLSVSARVY